MKGTTVLKLFLDIAMCVIYLMLMFAKGASDFFHEAAGIGIGILFIIHLILNRSMTKGLVSGIKKGSARVSRKLLGFSDIILCVGMPIVIGTGILIAKELFVIDSGLSWQTLCCRYTSDHDFRQYTDYHAWDDLSVPKNFCHKP